MDTQRAMVDELAAQLQVDQAVIDNAHTHLDYTRITSPIDGRTGIRLVDPGNIVHATAATGIVSLDQGTLSLVDNQIDQATGTAKLKAIFANAHNTLWPGQFVNARVLVRMSRNVLTVPTNAVQLGPNGPFTNVVKADSTVEVRPLKIGDESGGLTVVNSGLAVIFLFLRNAWATIIPGVTVPLALLGTAAMMYVLNYSLDNLSLMALTIAVGFVVDDAIVMLENIYRHIEAGLSVRRCREARREWL